MPGDPTERGAPPPPPSPEALGSVLRAFRPIELLLRPRFFGLAELQTQGPLMFVGNHQLLALDTPFLVAALWRHGIAVRPLADDFLFAVPALARVLERFGLVRADFDAARTLLDRRESVLVYPGGAREAVKGGGRGFELEWWDRLGFARLALHARSPVVPVAATGIDDAVRILLDREDYLAGPLARPIDLLHIRHDMLPPLFLPRRLPRPRFKLGPPIAIDHFLGHDEESAVPRLRAEIAEQLEQELRWLRRH